MAEMISDVIPDKPRSERIIFETLWRCFESSGWTVFYQHPVPNPKGGPNLKIDFLILIPEHSAVICLEAKGGSFDITRGKWYNSKGKHIYPSPPEQAENAMYGFRNKYLSGGKKLITCGCAVAFTDSSYPKGKVIPKDPLIIEEHVAGHEYKLADALIDYAQQLVASRPSLATDKAKENARIAFNNLEHNLFEEKNLLLGFSPIAIPPPPPPE